MTELKARLERNFRELVGVIFRQSTFRVQVEYF